MQDSCVKEKNKAMIHKVSSGGEGASQELGESNHDPRIHVW